MPRPVSPDNLENRIMSAAAANTTGNDLSLVLPDDFAAIATRDAIDTALHRLVRQGKLRRLARGVYHVPRSHALLGEIQPSMTQVVEALAAKHHLRIQPAGGYAANLVGLSEQVPMRLVYLTDGTPRRLRIGKAEIVFKRTTPKNMATAGKISGTVIQALRHIGRTRVDDKMITRLARRLRVEDRQLIGLDAEFAPAWVRARMQQIANVSSV